MRFCWMLRLVGNMISGLEVLSEFFFSFFLVLGVGADVLVVFLFAARYFRFVC